MHLVFMMGPAGVGKSTAIQHIFDLGQADPKGRRFGRVEVGKMMRAKYCDPASPHYVPDYFKAKSDAENAAAPKHSQAEAWQMLVDGIERCRAAGDSFVLIDGQPRDFDQVRGAIALPDPRTFVNLFAPVAVRAERVAKRDADNPEAATLSGPRVKGDIPRLYEIICTLWAAGENVVTYDTSVDGYTPSQIHTDLMWDTAMPKLLTEALKEDAPPKVDAKAFVAGVMERIKNATPKKDDFTKPLPGTDTGVRFNLGENPFDEG
jgi:hypothetical protein